MRTSKFLPMTLIASLFLIGCGGDEKGPSNEAVQRERSKKDRAEKEEHKGGSASLQLNDGEKWEADSSTKAGVKAMKRIMEEAPSSDSLQAHHELGDTLKSEFERIFEHCSMEGPGHEQLHHFLLPIKKDIQGLHSEDLEQAKGAKASIEKRLPKFEKYFE